MIYKVANKYDDETHFEIWPMKFNLQQTAEWWIKENYPRESYPDMEWVIVKDFA